MKHKYLINLLNPEDYLSVSQMFNPETGVLEEDQRIISLPEGPHMMFDFFDTIMYGTARYHEHSVGWETFFITSGCCDLTVRGKTCRLVPGDIIHVQPWMGHQMSFPEPTVYRGIFTISICPARLKIWLTFVRLIQSSLRALPHFKDI